MWFLPEEHVMPRADQSACTARQKRKARHSEEGYEERGVAKREAERGVPDTHVAARKSGRVRCGLCQQARCR